MSRYDADPETGPEADLSDPKERERLSPIVTEYFFGVMARWDVSHDDARRLLGNVSVKAWRTMTPEGGHVLDEDSIMRASEIVRIFAAVFVLNDEDTACGWLETPNRHDIFGGKTPLAHFLRGGRPAMEAVRELLEAELNGE